MEECVVWPGTEVRFCTRHDSRIGQGKRGVAFPLLQLGPGNMLRIQLVVVWKRSAVHAENDRQIVEPDLHASSEKFGAGRRCGAECDMNDPPFSGAKGRPRHRRSHGCKVWNFYF